MNREDIIEMALDAELPFHEDSGDLVNTAALERFAALVVAAEREACAKYFEDHWREEWTDEQIADAIRARGNT